jgi:ABC-type protease/lipase transport system fused ATPase/permease subunit
MISWSEVVGENAGEGVDESFEGEFGQRYGGEGKQRVVVARALVLLHPGEDVLDDAEVRLDPCGGHADSEALLRWELEWSVVLRRRLGSGSGLGLLLV